MVIMDLRDILRDIFGSYRVQFLQLPEDCSSPEASALDFQFRDQLYKSFDYRQMAHSIMALVPQDYVIDYKDDFGLHYLVFRDRGGDSSSFIFCDPYKHHSIGEKDYRQLLESRGLPQTALEAIRWYFKRIPVISDYLGWRQMLSVLLARYLANPDLEIRSVTWEHPEALNQIPYVSFSSIPYSSVEARYAVEDAMLDAIRRGDISEAIYQQNLFMGFQLDQRITDPLRDAKNMIIAVNTMYRKAIQMAEVHPLYIDAISGHFTVEIEKAETMDQLLSVIPKMIRHYCLLVQQHSLKNYSRLIRDCLNYIDFHYMEPLSLEQLARRFSVNKNYLSSRFHKEVQTTVTDYINRTRVQHAVQLLDQTALSMQQIAEKCGFADANYFTRIFRKLNGSSPNDYRKSMNRSV